ncbi:MAG: AAA family ATPase [Patescibacteria group bacterium]
MSAKTNEKKLDYLLCSSCQGRGEVNGAPCPVCQGRSLGLWLGDVLLFWGKSINSSAVLENQIRNIFKIIINSLLWVFGAVGIISLIWQLRLIWGTSPLSPQTNLLFLEGFWASVFWLSLVTDLYLFYRLSREADRQKKIKEKKYQSADDNLLASERIGNFSFFKQLDKKRKIDVSFSYVHDAWLAVNRSYLLARKLKHHEIEPVHLLASLLSFSKVALIIGRLGISRELLEEKLAKALAKLPVGQKTGISLKIRKILLGAYQNAYLQNRHRVEVIDLFYVACQLDETVSNIMYDFEADLNKINNVVMWQGFQQILMENWLHFRSASRFKPRGDIDRAMTALATPFLDHFSQNLTTLAKYGYFVPCIGRDKELEEIFRAIESGGQRNVILVGEPGVGKSAIIEGIAQKMVTEEVPQSMQDKRLMSLNIASLIGGTTPDKAQERLIRVMEEIIRAKNIILVVENIRELIGITTGEEESLDLSEIFAKYLLNGNFLCFTTATVGDYGRYIEGNNVLNDVFKLVKVPEVSRDGAIQVLELKSGIIEYSNRVFLTYEAIEKAVDLSSRFIHDKFLPSKAISVLEEAATMASKTRGKRTVVTGEDVAEIISQLTNIPATEVTQEESEKLLNLEARIHERIVGQNEAVKMVSTALRRARTELRSTKRPITNLMFLGPTGVGKTELAKAVAEVYFGNEKNMIRLDMSEYQETASLNRLIGTEDSPGHLTEAVRKNPFSLVLLDEIEKADLNILNIFLQVMDDGRLTDGRGRLIDFTNTIIIATSNACTPFIQEQVRAGKEVESVKDDLVNDKLLAYFRPEFLNRFDGIIIFKPLTREEVKSIARLMLLRVAKTLEERGLGLEATDSFIEELSVAGFDPVFGARPLRRVIQEKVDDVLANYILQKRLSRRDVIVFDEKGKVDVRRGEKE